MSHSVKCRQNAAECYEAARVLSDDKKTIMLARVQAWILLADLAARNSNLDPIYETPPPVEKS
jgi:hypothetical protein